MECIRDVLLGAQAREYLRQASDPNQIMVACQSEPQQARLHGLRGQPAHAASAHVDTLFSFPGQVHVRFSIFSGRDQWMGHPASDSWLAEQAQRMQPWLGAYTKFKVIGVVILFSVPGLSRWWPGNQIDLGVEAGGQAQREGHALTILVGESELKAALHKIPGQQSGQDTAHDLQRGLRQIECFPAEILLPQLLRYCTYLTAAVAGVQPGQDCPL